MVGSEDLNLRPPFPNQISDVTKCWIRNVVPRENTPVLAKQPPARRLRFCVKGFYAAVGHIR